MKNKIMFVMILLLATATVAFGSTFVYVKLNEKVNSASNVGGSAATDEDAGENDEFLVVTSCNPMYMATLNVCDGIENVRVVNLSQPTTGCLHDYTLTTGDMKTLAMADVFVINGAGMEGFLSDVMEAYPDLYVVTASEGLTLLEAEDDHDHEGHEDHDHEGHNHGDEGNSHCWMSSELFAGEVANIAEGLALVDSANHEKYVSNAKNYGQKLEAELSEYKSTMALSSANKYVMLFHEAFEYVAQDMWRETVGLMDLDEERQVSAGELQEVVEVVADNGNCTIFAEKEYGSQMAELVQDETGCKVVYLNPMIRGNYDKDSYIEIMKENYQKIVDSL